MTTTAVPATRELSLPLALPPDLALALSRLRGFAWRVEDRSEFAAPDGRPGGLFALVVDHLEVGEVSVAEFRGGCDEAHDIVDPRVLAALVAAILNGREGRE